MTTSIQFGKRKFELTWKQGIVVTVIALGSWAATYYVPATFWQSWIELLRPTNPTEFWTLVAGLGTAVLAGLAWSGLRSLGLTKSDMLTRATRDARECAIARSEEMASRLLPLNSEILESFAKAKVPVFVQNAGDVKFDPDNQTDLPRAHAWMKTIGVDMYNKSIGLLNALEGWAMYFTNGLADHEIAFPPCGPIYCSMIVQNYAILLNCRAGPGDGNFPNAVALFKGWNEMLDRQERGLKQGALLQELARLQAKGALNHPLPKPLGTHLDG
jgi:hypothetical protein